VIERIQDSAPSQRQQQICCGGGHGGYHQPPDIEVEVNLSEILGVLLRDMDKNRNRGNYDSPLSDLFC
tara:strand:+ start:323 stop:526 length:204 start_codon:yes stop_codon:yes gene_type:complete